MSKKTKRAAGEAAGAPEGGAAAPDKKRAKLKAAKARLAELERLLDAEAEASTPAISPFAPAAFPDLAPVAGVTMAAAEAGVKYQGRLDVALVSVAGGDGGRGPSVAGVFTRSKTRSAPVLWCEETLAAAAEQPPKRLGILVNAGNANAFTGAGGVRAVKRSAQAAATALGARDAAVFVASTGVIGEPLPAERIVDKLADLAAARRDDAWEAFARAIMTTDTFPKGASATVSVAGRPVVISGVAKGSGMIAPDMGTMLAFVFTDAAVSPKALQRLLAESADRSFNATTVDGDTSTSDTVIAAATGLSDAPLLSNARSEGWAAFREGFDKVMLALAHQVVRDGEGATKFVRVSVSGAKTERAARRIGLAIANSPLVKTAWAGEDPNWGRIVMAVGKSGEDADRDRLAIAYGDHPVAEKGLRAAAYDEAVLAAYMKRPELHLHVDVGVGAAEADVWTCDLTHRYVSINADYRS